ncbi:host-nuclease inhibitor Gam family protein [Sphingopyxis sp. GW247-27LB]|uniref:host-nuclease inhibitor Gam family protein n=1 Tax=Sphingopyxis sp. GW247-27LB TaxID=2012632 RepID=UPI001594FAA1|nr:host-nuclease inhibitor Gam family protein [Sphingopyxis sp. GW247-27LB]
MSRRKQAALPVPATDEEAIALLAKYGEVERLLRADADLADHYIAKIKAEHDTAVAEHAPAQRERFAALKAWWEAGGAQRLAGKKRSADLAGAKIGIRLGNKSVRIAKGKKLDDIIAWISSLRWSGKSLFLRRGKVTLDKEAIITAWPKDESVRRTFERAGVTVAQDDEFFIDVGPAETAKEARSDG